MIDRATQARIKEAAKIVEVVGDYVHLTRRGANYMGLCPFHNENTPSFSVSPRRNFCYCFSCHKGGSPVNFIMEKEGIGYYEALRQLARKYGIRIEEREISDEERESLREREALFIANQRAMEIMQQNLLDSEEGRNVGLTYFFNRGITEEAIRKFNLGYAIDYSNNLTAKMESEGFKRETLRTLGLTGISAQGRVYDRYSGRVIFPIRNVSGKVVGFGGRTLRSNPAKYINSPESPVYHKKRELYGIYQAKADIRDKDCCYLVEGYMDVISMWQSGVRNVVASSGTALTTDQIALIHRFTDNIILIYDGDSAGIKAALRGIDMLLENKMNVKVLLLPGGHDPDSFAKENTPQQLQDYLKSHETDVIRFKIEALKTLNGDSLQERVNTIKEIAKSLASMPDVVTRRVYISDAARLLEIDEATMVAAVDEQSDIIRRERRLNRGSHDDSTDEFPETVGPGNATVESPAADAAESPGSPIPPGSQRAPGLQSNPVKEYPLLPLEKAIVRCLVRNGYMPLHLQDLQPAADDNPDGDVLYTVTDLVADELEARSLMFTVPQYQRLFKLLYDHLDEYVDLLDKRKLAVEDEIASMREKGLQDIAGRVSTLPEIEKEERLLNSRLEARRDELLTEFAKRYPGDLLASHEDDGLRDIATDMLGDRYTLSRLFVQPHSEDETTELNREVIRHFNEWESELLTLRMQQLRIELSSCDGSDPEHEQELLRKYSEIQSQRATLAKSCGERIVASRK